MEAGEAGARQSDFPRSSFNTPNSLHQHSRATTDRQPQGPPAMAAATLISPAPSFHPHNPTFSPGYSHAPPPPPPAPSAAAHNMSSLLTSRESPRISSESEPQRQSLPSLSEVFSNSKARPFSPTTPTSAPSSQGLPPPFAPPAPTRSDSASEPRPAPPRDDKFFRFSQRPEAGPSHGAPAPSYPFAERDAPPKAPEPAPTAAPHIPYPPQPGSLPPGQYPLSHPPISPRHPGPPGPPYDPHRPLHAEEEYGMHRNRYDSSTLTRHFEAWNYQESLNRIAMSARTLCHFADTWQKIASEQNGGQPIPERLPSDREIHDMLGNVDWVRQSLQNVRELVQACSIANEKAREGGKSRGPYEDDEMSMYGDVMKQQYALGEGVKKRRGRAAPPGRCHSCNRIDTPEWRRGPDGARTLCNACGLHYAKLERKRQMEQRAIRPKGVDERTKV